MLYNRDSAGGANPFERRAVVTRSLLIGCKDGHLRNRKRYRDTVAKTKILHVTQRREFQKNDSVSGDAKKMLRKVPTSLD